jgi:hypothetical protein
LIDFFGQPDVQEICKLSSEGTTFISSEDVAKYLVNHLSSNTSFKSVSKTILKYDESNDSLVTSLLNSLKNHLSSKKSLPSSFSTKAIREFYLQIKSQ